MKKQVLNRKKTGRIAYCLNRKAIQRGDNDCQLQNFQKRDEKDQEEWWKEYKDRVSKVINEPHLGITIRKTYKASEKSWDTKEIQNPNFDDLTNGIRSLKNHSFQFMEHIYDEATDGLDKIKNQIKNRPEDVNNNQDYANIIDNLQRLVSEEFEKEVDEIEHFSNIIDKQTNKIEKVAMDGLCEQWLINDSGNQTKWYLKPREYYSILSIPKNLLIELNKASDFLLNFEIQVNGFMQDFKKIENSITVEQINEKIDKIKQEKEKEKKEMETAYSALDIENPFSIALMNGLLTIGGEDPVRKQKYEINTEKFSSFDGFYDEWFDKCIKAKFPKPQTIQNKIRSIKPTQKEIPIQTIYDASKKHSGLQN